MQVGPPHDLDLAIAAAAEIGAGAVPPPPVADAVPPSLPVGDGAPEALLPPSE